jgi:sulfur-oxidizing protein SoxY
MTPSPSPVAAVFHFADPRERAALGLNIRLDEESAVRVIVEASDHRLYMTAAFIKASGLGVCAAPPVRPAGHRPGDRPNAAERSDQR